MKNVEMCSPHGGARCCPVASLQLRTDPPDTQRRPRSRGARGSGGGQAWPGWAPGWSPWVRARLPGTETASGRGACVLGAVGERPRPLCPPPGVRAPEAGRGRGAAPPRPSGRPAGGRAAFPRPWPLQSRLLGGASAARTWCPRPPAGPDRETERPGTERASARGRGRREEGWGLPRWAGTSSPAPPSFPRKPKPRPDLPCETAAPPAGLSAERATRAAAAAPPGLCLSPLLWLSLRAPSERNQPPASAWASCGGQPPACCLPDARTGVPTELALSWGARGLWAPPETGAPSKGVCAPGSPQLRPARHPGCAGLRLVSTCRDRGAWRACTLHLPCCWDWALLASGLWTV